MWTTANFTGITGAEDGKIIKQIKCKPLLLSLIPGHKKQGGLRDGALCV